MSNQTNDSPCQVITLRNVRLSDVAFVYSVENDPDVWQYGTSSGAPYTAEMIRQFCAAMVAADGRPDDAGQLRLIIELKGDPIGMIDLYNYDSRSQSAKVAIIVYPTAERGKGYGRAAIHALITYARAIGIDALSAEIASNNQKSHNLFLSCGFQFSHSSADGVMHYNL